MLEKLVKHYLRKLIKANVGLAQTLGIDVAMLDGMSVRQLELIAQKMNVITDKRDIEQFIKTNLTNQQKRTLNQHLTTKNRLINTIDKSQMKDWEITDDGRLIYSDIEFGVTNISFLYSHVKYTHYVNKMQIESSLIEFLRDHTEYQSQWENLEMKLYNVKLDKDTWDGVKNRTPEYLLFTVKDKEYEYKYEDGQIEDLIDGELYEGGMPDAIFSNIEEELEELEKKNKADDGKMNWLLK